MNFISDILYWISTGLLVPVIVLLIHSLLPGTVTCRQFLRTVYVHSQNRSFAPHELGKLTSETVGELNSKFTGKVAFTRYYVYASGTGCP